MPAHTDATQCWQQCQADWLNQIERRSGGPNTRRAYEADMKDFYATTNQPPGSVTAAHAEAWVQALSARGLAAATLRRKLSALASLYTYAGAYPYTNGAGPTTLWPQANPFSNRTLRPQRTAAPVAFPTTDQVLDLLRAIDAQDAIGIRNLALIAGLVLTTRRINEWLPLTAADFEHIDRLHWFRYRCKGGEIIEQQLPDSLWQLIESYLRAALRWPLAPDQHIWIALSDAGERLHPRSAADGHLNPGYVSRLIKRYGKLAGIPAACLHPHALRHAGAQLRRENGADILALQAILAHKSPATTVSYLRKLDRPRDPQADTIADLLLRWRPKAR